MILEPVGRNTAPAVAIAALCAMEEDADPVLLVLPADHVIRDVDAFVDAVGRAAFDNYREYVALYGADRPIAEMPQPRITMARHLPQALRARLGMERAA